MGWGLSRVVTLEEAKLSTSQLLAFPEGSSPALLNRKTKPASSLPPLLGEGAAGPLLHKIALHILKTLLGQLPAPG